MKITFLWTSHGCAEKGRFVSSTLFEVNGAMYVVDAGAPVDAQLLNNDKNPQNL